MGHHAVHETNSFVCKNFQLVRSDASHYETFLICLIALFLSLSKPIQPYDDVAIADEGLQVLTYSRHSWLLSSVGSLRCQNQLHDIRL